MEINPSYTTIGKLFENNFLFEVPKYQRYYAWEEEQVADFITDIEKMFISRKAKTPTEHFFGGIVCVNKSVPGSSRQQTVLIDGQQRLSTVILLIVNIIKTYQLMLNNLTEEAENLVNGRITKLQEQYLKHRDEINMKIEFIDKLVLSDADKDFFKNIINGQKQNPSRSSHERLNKAYHRLNKFVDKIIKECASENERLESLKFLEDTINVSSYIIFIRADTKDTAYKLFQVLNDRGIGLTEGDLLKSKTLEALERDCFVGQQQQLQQIWDKILGDAPEKISDFFKRYYSSVTGTRVGRASMYDDLMKEFFPGIVEIEQVETLEEADKIVTSMHEMKRDKDVYDKINTGEWLYEFAPPIKTWNRNRLYVLTNYLGYDNSIPLLMAASLLDQKDFSHIVFSLEKFMFRYKGICNNNVQNISELFMKEARVIRSSPEKYRIGNLLSKLESLLESDANDVKFKQNIKYLKYRPKLANKNLKYFYTILSEHYIWYANGARTSKSFLDDLPVLPYDAATIEHIYPQNPEKTDPVFKDFDVHRIGNLTILTGNENERVKNKEYVHKKDQLSESNYLLNKYFEGIDAWSLEAVEERENMICDLACKVFRV